MELPQARKRPRPVVSCLRCREKKLKCDRVAPCQNCTKAGCQLDCTYNARPSAHPQYSPDTLLPENKRARYEPDETEIQHGPSRTGIGILEDLQQRVKNLEALLGARPHAGNSDSTDTTIQGSWPQPDVAPFDSSMLGTLVVKGSRSRYHGQNNRITLLNQFPDAKIFINQCAQDSALVGLAKEVQFLQNKFQSPVNSPASVSSLGSSLELQEMLTFLPPRAVCDHLLDVYFKNFEKTFRIIHISSFRRNYENFWTGTDHEPAFVAFFVPLLTGTMSIAVVLDPQPYASDYSSSWNYLREDAVDLISTWLQKIPRKQQTELSTLQLSTLNLLSRQLRLASVDEMWKASGSLVRSAMVMGLHVNLSNPEKVTPFQTECRRRLWITIVEMDLQASIVTGLPVMTPELDFGPLMPSNLNDSDFDESTSALPPPRPPNEKTDTFSQIALATSLSERIKTMNLVRQTRPKDSMTERLVQGQLLEKRIKDIPSSLKPDNQSEHTDLGHTLNCVLLDLDPSFPDFQKACLDSSLAILSYQEYFDPDLISFDMRNAQSYWNVFYMFFHNDIMWASMSVCDHLKLLNKQVNDRLPSASFSSRTISSSGLSHNKTSLTRLIESTLDNLTRRIGEKGCNVKDIILLAVVLQSARARGPTDQKERGMFQRVKKALAACRQQLLAAAMEHSFPLNLQDPTLMSNENTERPSTERPSTEAPPFDAQLPDFLQPSSALADEFNDFHFDLFSFDEGSLTWNV